ncbi:hypothetical protein ACQ86D_19395 [Streptomyces galilaeus]
MRARDQPQPQARHRWPTSLNTPHAEHRGLLTPANSRFRNPASANFRDGSVPNSSTSTTLPARANIPATSRIEASLSTTSRVTFTVRSVR